jgi:transcriptional regulator with XRE-family HTH domain
MERFWSQDELAERSGVGRATIHRLESGTPARLSTIRRLASTLGVEPRELTQASEQQPGHEEAAA